MDLWGTYFDVLRSTSQYSSISLSLCVLLRFKSTYFEVLLLVYPADHITRDMSKRRTFLIASMSAADPPSSSAPTTWPSLRTQKAPKVPDSSNSSSPRTATSPAWQECQAHHVKEHIAGMHALLENIVSQQHHQASHSMAGCAFDEQDCRVMSYVI